MLAKPVENYNDIVKEIVSQNILKNQDKIICDYCKEEIDNVNHLAKINNPDKNFCCLGCLEKYEEKQKREKFQAVELPQDTIQRLCKAVRDQQSEIETLKEENDLLIIENTDLKKESSRLSSLCAEIAYDRTELTEKLKKAEEEKIYYKTCADDFRQEKEDLKAELKTVKYKHDVEVKENYEIQEENDKLKGDIENFQAVISSYEKASEKRDKEIEELKFDNANLEVFKEKLTKEHEKFLIPFKKDYCDKCNKYVWDDIEKAIINIKIFCSDECAKNDNQNEIEELKRAIENEKIRADGYKRNSELIASQQAEVKLEKRQVEEKLKRVDRFISDALKIVENDSPICILLLKSKEIINNGQMDFCHN